MTLNDWLLAAFVSAIGLWLGGAITAEIWLASARRRSDPQLLAHVLPLAGITHMRLYLPLAVVACASGLGLAWRLGLSLGEWWVRAPVVVYMAALLVSVRYLLPAYRELARLTANPETASVVGRRLDRVSWVSRGLVLAVSLSLWNVALHLGL